ncbi:uncharacterized protein EDB93DRAFT_1073770 [Suillus bovinus]|uniref:uncharacterized protein n=1 Tax=Suillus bovinus TaxID=48563 RepID=UPI001B87044A|nr:uncharacterized protein EDB93DRAFT_1073770 [Suillus bovinus]KAG2160155.1 hypothetical protein EDB93DRAFT_1073770 [Suillus bovinus]
MRSTARSFPQPSSALLSGTGAAPAHIYYEPRVIRVDTTCPTSPPSRARRSSATGIRAPSAQRPAMAHSSAGPFPPDTTPFPRPAYLDHSALRQLLQTDTPSQFFSLPKPDLAVARTEYAGGRRRVQRSPSFDTDEEDTIPPGEMPSRQQQENNPLMSSALLCLPTRWCEEYRSSMLSVSADGRDLTYQGSPSNSDKDAAAAHTIFPIPPACGIYYYEVEVTSKTNSNKGLVSRDFKLTRLPGWEKNSWGYHGDDGSSFAAEKTGTPYGPQFGAGDVIGCGIDFSQNRAFYTKNGALLGSVFDNIGKDCDIYPAVGLCHPGESVRANFGQDPFKFDIEDHVLQQRNTTWSRIQSAPWTWPVANSDKDITSTTSTAETHVKSQINDLVLSYLSHHGYARTARAFEAQCSARGGMSTLRLSNTFPSSSTSRVSDHDQIMDMDDVPQTPTIAPAPMDDIEIRTRIVRAVLTGDVDTALSDTRTHFPRALDADAGLVLFKLRCRKFVELVLEAAELKKRMCAEDAEMNVEADGEDKGISEGMGMDVDDEADISSTGATNGFGRGSSAIPIKGKRKASFASYSHSDLSGVIAAKYGTALERAVAYGQELQSEYKDRPEMRAIFKRTSVVVAFEDPLEAGGDAAEVAGQGARVSLATEVNQAILLSQGRPAHPALERIYRHTAASLTQLALIGNGAAAFVDMPRELLDA